MDKILMILRQWLERLGSRDGVADDPLAHLSPLELADLPAVHQARKEGS
jgi:hypothetical protein